MGGNGEEHRMKRIEIKLEECCLACENFDLSGIQGISPYSLYAPPCCGEPERVIACGHMKVCKTYLEAEAPMEN